MTSPREPSTSARFTDVADTAVWVAAYRARESSRPDPLFHDPYAARLAGERGEQLARAMVESAFKTTSSRCADMFATCCV